MKRLCAALLCLLLAGLWGCGKQEPTVAPGPWDVTIEEIDLSKPENQKYIDWAKKRPSWYNTRTYDEPKYFDVTEYQMQAFNESDPWIYIREAGATKELLLERYRPWNETLELVIRKTYIDNDWDGYTELLVREKATGETERVDEGYFADYDGVVFDPVVILSDTRFLYHKWYWDGGSYGYCLYDLGIGERINVWGNYGGLCDLGNERYLWNDGSAIYLIDARALETGEKDAKRTLVRWDYDYGCEYIQHLSSDKRFVYVELYRDSDSTRHRGVYDVETGEQVAFFEIPVFTVGNSYNYVLISDDLEYVYNWAGNVDDPTIYTFFIIHYDRTGDKN